MVGGRLGGGRPRGAGAFPTSILQGVFVKRQQQAAPPPTGYGLGGGGGRRPGRVGGRRWGPPRGRCARPGAGGRGVRPSPSSSRAGLAGRQAGQARGSPAGWDPWIKEHWLCGGLQGGEVEQGGCGLTWVRASGQRRAVSWFPGRTGTSRPLSSFVRSRAASHCSYKPSVLARGWGSPEQGQGPVVLVVSGPRGLGWV